jgi:hypothetical protein
MLKDWSEEDPEPQEEDPEPQKVRSLSRPVIGICISICVAVPSLIIAAYTSCSSGGFNRDGSLFSDPAVDFALFVFCISILSASAASSPG